MGGNLSLTLKWKPYVSKQNRSFKQIVILLSESKVDGKHICNVSTKVKSESWRWILSLYHCCWYQTWLYSNLLTSVMSVYLCSLVETWFFLFPASENDYLKEIHSAANPYHSGMWVLCHHQLLKKSEKETVHNCW